MDRPFCSKCGKNLAAINYIRNGKTYYRRQCAACLRLRACRKPQTPRWVKSGYHKKAVCERCGFKAKYREQLFVYHVDGNLGNSDWVNLKTICSNCRIEIEKTTGWSSETLTPDF